MGLVEYRERLSRPLRQATLCFLRKNDEVMLAMKKRGFGKGRWNGVGGKLKINESVEEAAKRETKEEISVLPRKLNHVATLDFYFPHYSEWNQQVIVYITESWEGEPAETEEMKPRWFNKDELPLDSMWPDDEFWLPLVLQGKNVKAEFLFGSEDVILDFNVTEINSYDWNHN